jgi:hypothetical protein
VTRGAGRSYSLGKAEAPRRRHLQAPTGAAAEVRWRRHLLRLIRRVLHLRRRVTVLARPKRR